MQKTYFLALGSNLGDKLGNLREAIQLLDNSNVHTIKCAPIYESKALLTEESNEYWDINYLNSVIEVHTNMHPMDLLSAVKNIEKTMGRDLQSPRWSPRIIDIDIILSLDYEINNESLTIPHKLMDKRSFVIKPLIDIHPIYLHQHPNLSYLMDDKNTIITPYSLDKNRLMYIANIGDSFSNKAPENIIYECIKALDAGAEIIDIGYQSTHPDANYITQQEESYKILPILKELNEIKSKYKYNFQLSLDSYKPEVIENCLEYIDILNDVSSNINNAKLINKYQRYIFMHNTGLLSDKKMWNSDNPIDDLLEFYDKNINFLKYILDKKQIIFDPGLGFGKNIWQTNQIVSNLDIIRKNCSIDIILGHSRKASCMPYAKHLKSNQRDIESAFLSAKLSNYCDILRVHDIEMTNRLIKANNFINYNIQYKS